MANWIDECVPLLRILINDFSGEPTYTDSRLTDILIAAAYVVKQEVPLVNTYTVSIANKTISPDPVSISDDLFISLLVLKAACMADQSTYRTKALIEGITATLGPANLSVSGNLAGFQKLLEVGVCATYQEMRDQQVYGGEAIMANIKVILGPFVSNKIDPSMLQQSYNSHHRNWS